MSEVKFAVEKLVDMLEEGKRLFPIHWREIALDTDKIPLVPDYEKYIGMEELGMLHVCTARLDGELVGYFITFVMPHLHYSETIFGKVDIYYVHPDYRKNGIGFSFFKYHEAEMKRLGVVKLMNVCKPHLDHTPLFEALGYTKFETVFAKLL